MSGNTQVSTETKIIKRKTRDVLVTNCEQVTMEANQLRRMMPPVTSAGRARARLQVCALWREFWLYIFSILSEREFHTAHCLVYGSDVS